MPRKHHRAGWLRRAPRLRVRAGVQRHQRRGVRHVPRRAVQDVQRDGPLHALRAGHVLNCARRKRLGHVHHVPGRDEHVARGAGRARRLQVQQGLHGPRRGGGVHRLRRRKVEADEGVAAVHRLPRGHVLYVYRAHAGDAVYRLCGQLLVPLGVQRGGRLLRDLLHDGGAGPEHAAGGGDKHNHRHPRDQRGLCPLQEHRRHAHGPYGRHRRRLHPAVGRLGRQRGGAALWELCVV
mmetsp:Transcript_9450/g.22064  ORF Transcript_9450/g.22064 Transcript_9450/m.22064 type:complete len:236 (+) Transcript_9450:1759-2466(+)